MGLLSWLSRPANAERATAERDDREKTVLFLGAGASAACGGPLTNAILPEAIRLVHSDTSIDRSEFSTAVLGFLKDNFHLPAMARPADYPPLPLLLSLIDTALEKGEGFGAEWKGDRLQTVRHGIEYLTFIVLEQKLARISGNPHMELLHELRSKRDQRVTVISLNYDVIVDNTLAALTGALPDYVCDVRTQLYLDGRKLVSSKSSTALLKLHGSLNWIYCPNRKCQRLDVGVSANGMGFVKVRQDLYEETPKTSLAGHYTCEGKPCPSCGTTVRPIMITPTQRKDYENPHIARVWQRARQELSAADHVHIVGYSLPPEDVDVIYLLKSGLSHLPPERIHVVDYDPASPPLVAHPAGNGYRALFGDRIDWHPEGFVAYVEALTGRPVVRDPRNASPPGIFPS